MKNWMICLVAGALVAGCGEKEAPDSPDQEGSDEPATRVASVQDGSAGNFQAAAVEDLSGSALDTETFTYAPGYIEIDRLDNGASADFGDANLHAFTGTAAQLAACAAGAGADPYDGSCDARLPSTNYPACTSPTQTDACACTGDAALDTDTCIEVAFTDWNELLTDGAGAPDAAKLDAHRLLDAVKTDGSSFKNGSCVTETKVLGKMDLTAAAVANNSEYSYLALKRFDNNGDAGYSWIFTTVPPAEDPSFGGCSEGNPLVYTLTQGDVLIVGNFNPSSGADLVVRRVSAAADGLKLLAQDVVDPTAQTGTGDDVWEPIPGSQNLAAVNTTDTAVGVLENISGVDQAGNRTDRGAVTGTPGAYAVAPNIFAEAAVDFRVFTSGGNLCEQRFYGSVITQPSSSKTSDLKDLLGPQLFNFGSMQAEAEISPSCDKSLDYAVTSLSAPGIDSTDPDSISGVVCTWTFTHESGATKTANDCSGTLDFEDTDPEGTWTGAVEVEIASGVSCSTSREVGSVTVFDALSASANAAPGCGLDFEYSGSATGGSDAATTEWEFSGPGTSTDNGDGTVTVDAAGTYTAKIKITDVRDDITCSADASATVDVAAQLAVEPTLTPTCDLAFGYDATVTGGATTPSVSWSFSGPGNVTPSDANATSGTADVDADGTYTATVTVSETRGDRNCTASGSADVDAFEALAATIKLDETCGLGFDYGSTVSGGSGSVTYEWAFPGGTPADSSTASGSVSVGSAGNYGAALTVTDNRSDVSCSVNANGSIDVFEALQITKADLSPTCDLAFDYAAAFTGGSASATAEWAFSGPGAVTADTSALSGSATVGADGTYTGTFTVTDVMPNGVKCSVDSADSVAAYTALDVEATTEDLCDSSFNYDSSVTGGSPAGVSYAWTFSGEGTVTADTTAASGNASVTVADRDYTGGLVVTDNRGDITCTASTSVSAHPLEPVTVNITPSSVEETCSVDGFSDAITYTAHVGGGDGSYSYSWSGCSDNGDGTCTVDPNDSVFCANQTVNVTVDDTSTICGEKKSEDETYTKQTIVKSSNN